MPPSRRDLAVLEALLPAGAHPRLKGLSAARLAEFLADFDRAAEPALKLGLRAALWTAAWAAPALIGRLPPLDRLAPGDREAALEAMEKSRSYHVRQMLLLLKAMAALCYGADPEVRRAVGFPGAAR